MSYLGQWFRGERQCVHHALLAPWLSMAILLVFVIAAGCEHSGDRKRVVEFWAMGSEGERIRPMIDEFERLHPDVRIVVQQIPWTAAHEKLLTAFAGDSLPDVCQLGNTWIAEFAALGALVDVGPQVDASKVVDREQFFPGQWQTNVIDKKTFGIPWYVDTRLMFYRKDLLAAAGHDHPPTSWDEWLTTMRDVRAKQPPGGYAVLLPVNEFEQPIIFGMQTGSTMLKDGGRYGNFNSPEFRRALEFYVNIFREKLAPTQSNTEVANVWQEFERGNFPMYITGPWNVNEFRLRMSPSMNGKWSTAPLPSPDGQGPGKSSAGGSTLVMFASSSEKEAAWQFMEFLGGAREQADFFRLSTNLPGRRDSWELAGLLKDPEFVAFHEQLKNVAPAPPAPEWEQIVSGEVVKTVEAVIRRQEELEPALVKLDRRVDRILEKRRWMLDRRESN